MGKYEELDSLQKLKESGSITEKEFEIEKYKILNSNNNTNQSNTEGIYIASLVLGICSFLFGGIPILGLILSIVALVICIKSRKKLKSNNETKGIVTAGLVLSIIGLILSILIFVFVFLNILSIGTAFINSSTSPIENNIDFSEVEKSAFNGKFIPYEGTIKYSIARNLIDAVKINNKSSDKYIKLNGENIVNDTNREYKVTLHYGSNGLVDEITIK